MRDESDREGFRVVYDLKKDAIPNVVLNNLFKYTQLQSSFGVNNVALVKGRPQTLNLKDLIFSSFVRTALFTLLFSPATKREELP